MATKCSGWREFAKFVSYHVFRDVDWHMAPTVVDGDGMTDHLREDCTCPAPGPYHDFLILVIELLNLFEQFWLTK